MYHFIVNPSSSSGKGLAVWTKVEAILSQKHIKYRATLLEHPGEAREIAASGTLKGKVILVGGDGTINEFLSGLSSFEGITFGYIPTGSGNDFARGMRLPAAPAEALEKILTSRRRRYINIGTVSADGISRSFAVSSGAGYDAAVCHEADRDQAKELLNRFRAGKLIYFKNALKMLFSMRTFSLRLVLDNGTLRSWDKVYFAAAMNTKYEGGGFRFCPDADPTDDMLDVIVAEGIPKLIVLLVLPTAFFGLHRYCRGVHIYRCKKARLLCGTGQCVHTDGEHVTFAKDISFSLRSEKLKLIV